VNGEERTLDKFYNHEIVEVSKNIIYLEENTHIARFLSKKRVELARNI